jgi:hypothetical protein
MGATFDSLIEHDFFRLIYGDLGAGNELFIES